MFHLLRTAPRGVTALAASSVVLLLVKAFYLNRLPALFPGAYELGGLVDAVLESLVASYVFYLVVVHVKEQADRRTVRPYVGRHTDRVVGDCRAQLADLARAAEVPLDLATLTEADVAAAFAKLDPNGRAPLIVGGPPDALVYANWLGYFDHHMTWTRASVARVLAQLVYLDAPLVGLLTAVDDCTFFAFVTSVRGSHLRNRDMTAWASLFPEYCEHCRRLGAFTATRAAAGRAA